MLLEHYQCSPSKNGKEDKQSLPQHSSLFPFLNQKTVRNIKIQVNKLKLSSNFRRDESKKHHLETTSTMRLFHKRNTTRINCSPVPCAFVQEVQNYVFLQYSQGLSLGASTAREPVKYVLSDLSELTMWYLLP